jgi:tetratricopeptide (TPR) repeat protein
MSKFDNPSDHSQRKLRAINYNNRAISEMQRGKYELSIRQLSRALQLFKDLNTVYNVQRPSSTENDMAPREICDDLGRHLSGLLCSDGGCDRMKEGPYLFTRGLSIPRRAAQSSQSNVLMIKVTMFNLGLSHQMMAAQRSGAEAGKYLDKAGKLYQLCYQVKTQMHPEAQRDFLLALINNLGIVHFKMQETDHTLRCFHGLITMVMYANATIVEDSTYCNNYNIDHFLANAFNIVHKHCLPASAA